MLDCHYQSHFLLINKSCHIWVHFNELTEIVVLKKKLPFKLAFLEGHAKQKFMTFSIANTLLLSQCVIINHINLQWSWNKHILPENGFTAKTEDLKNCQIMARVIFRAVSKMSYCKFSTALRTYIIALRGPFRCQSLTKEQKL